MAKKKSYLPVVGQISNGSPPPTAHFDGRAQGNIYKHGICYRVEEMIQVDQVCGDWVPVQLNLGVIDD